MRRTLDFQRGSTVSSKMMCRDKEEQECEDPLSLATDAFSLVQQQLPRHLWQAVHCSRNESRGPIMNNKCYLGFQEAHGLRIVAAN